MASNSWYVNNSESVCEICDDENENLSQATKCCHWSTNRQEDSRQAGKMLFVSVSVALKGWLPADEVPCEKPHTVREGEFFFLKKDFFLVARRRVLPLMSATKEQQRWGFSLPPPPQRPPCQNAQSSRYRSPFRYHSNHGSLKRFLSSSPFEDLLLLRSISEDVGRGREWRVAVPGRKECACAQRTKHAAQREAEIHWKQTTSCETITMTGEDCLKRSRGYLHVSTH